MKIAVVGGGAAGLFGSLLLARAGHEVVVLEADPIRPAPDVESAAAAAFRPWVPQIVQPHIVMARAASSPCARSPCVRSPCVRSGGVRQVGGTRHRPVLVQFRRRLVMPSRPRRRRDRHHEAQRDGQHRPAAHNRPEYRPEVG
jgi:choline dehydrogenase-like flavoprotein